MIRSRVLAHGVLVIQSTLAFAAAPPPPPPPVAPVRDVVNVHHGVEVHDPYRYMEDMKDPQVRAWFRGQADVASATLAAIPGREKIFSRIRELDAAAPYRIRVLRRWPDGTLHYLKRTAGENLDKLYVRSPSGEEKLLIDPEQLGRGDDHVSLSFCVPSPDRRLIAYGIAAAGSEQVTLKVRDATRGEDLPISIDRIESDYTPPHWLPDGRGFVYSRRRALPPGAPPTEVYKRTAAHLHQLGAGDAEDPVVFSMDLAAMADVDFPSVVLTPGSRYAIGKVKHGDSPDLSLFVLPVDQLAEVNPRWKKLCGVGHKVTQFAVRGDEAFLLTAAASPRYSVVRASLAEPDMAKAVEFLGPQANGVVDHIAVAADALYVTLLSGSLNSVLRLPYGGGPREPIPLPAETPSGEVIEATPDRPGALVMTSAWTRRGRIHSYDPLTAKLTDTGLLPRGRFDDPEGYESREVLVASHDGAKVPLSIVHKKGLTLDGGNPTLLVGYGAYGSTMTAGFRPTRLAWLERDGVLAFAHVRGGGAYGREWHLAGRMGTKPNTWKDFIACAEFLVAEKYTSPAKLAGQGGSAGGILIGRAITERPDLFGAAIINVGCLDAVRMETTTNGVPNIQEFGSVATREGFDALLAMSAYHHVTDGVRYPAVLLTHGINDPRVEPWMSAKMAARLQAASASGRPVLFRVDYHGGHGIGSTRDQEHALNADQTAFLLWQLGDPEFRPAGK